MNNGKKEFPINGFEYDCISTWGRKHLCYVNNIPRIKKIAKRMINKRFRKFNKNLENNSEDN